jgi:hypothetical protein
VQDHAGAPANPVMIEEGSMDIEELGMTLPPIQAAPRMFCAVTKSYKYISLVFHSGAGTEPTAFTIHQADARPLLDAIGAAIEQSPEGFEVRVIGRSVEGFAAGGPPCRDQLSEFAGET